MATVGFVRMGVIDREADRVPEIGVGMLGYGFMGKAHTNAYRAMPLFMYPPPARPRLVAICGRQLDALKRAAERYGYDRYYTDWRDVIRDPDVELVDIGLPNAVHHGPAIAAADAEKPVLCEKPLATTVEAAAAMTAAVAKAQVKNMVGFNYRFVPALRLAKDLIDRGAIGKILHFHAAYLQEWIMDPAFPRVWRLDRTVAGAGALGDLGSHLIDLARFLVGEIVAVCAATTTIIPDRPLPEDPTQSGAVTVDDAFMALIKFQPGALGVVEASRFCAGRKNYQRIEIYGTEGSILFNLERLNELAVYSRHDPETQQGFKTILVTETEHPFIQYWWPHGHTLGWEHTFTHQAHHFINAIVNDEDVAPYGATFHDGLRCNQVLDAITTSAAKGQWIPVTE